MGALYRTTTSFCELKVGADWYRVTYSDLKTGVRRKQVEEITALLQAQLDVRQPLADLPSDDPDKTVDPDRSNLFWGDSAGEKVDSLSATHLVGRSRTVSNVHWDGEKFQASFGG